MSGRVRWSVDPKATKRIRFDDAEFHAALTADAAKENSPLAKLLDVPAAADADFSDFIADGVYINARIGITAGEEDQLQNMAQQDDARQGVKVDVDRYNRAWFAVWVLGVGSDEPGAEPAAGLSDPSKRRREDAIGALPAPVRSALFARLRVHVDDVSRPAMRDPRLSPTTEG